MIYKNLSFQIPNNRLFFYSSFVTTIDGKIFVKKPGYWPIGSNVDYDTFTFLRAHADVIIDGKETAIAFGDKTIETIHKPSFVKLRKSLGKTKDIAYYILTKHPKVVSHLLHNPYAYKPTIVSYASLHDLSKILKKNHHKTIFIDGGPTLLKSFIQENLLNELFITIAPKIFAGHHDEVLSMVEGDLFSANNIPQMTLIDVKSYKNEVFLRYRKKD